MQAGETVETHGEGKPAPYGNLCGSLLLPGTSWVAEEAEKTAKPMGEASSYMDQLPLFCCPVLARMSLAEIQKDKQARRLIMEETVNLQVLGPDQMAQKVHPWSGLRLSE